MLVAAAIISAPAITVMFAAIGGFAN